eukprot:GHVS01037284.1.p1 GENE.GHVS01037284.1~~GHVS01037284.1.p1  ORF type:complete len:111 (+),score=12.13 GHVS01037284.1:447-779(+)
MRNRKTLEHFGTEVEEYRNSFDSNSPFYSDVSFYAYAKIDEFFASTTEMETKAKEFNNLVKHNTHRHAHAHTHVHTHAHVHAHTHAHIRQLLLFLQETLCEMARSGHVKL